jgi:hypothetical protein
MPTSAVSVLRARCHASAVGAELVVGATIAADSLADGYSGQPTSCSDRDSNHYALEERPAMTGSG